MSLDLESYARILHGFAGARIDYAGLRGSPQWAGILRGLASSDPAALASREERLAFWINAYNVLALDLVAAHWPVASIVDIGTAQRPVWGRTAGVVHGFDVTLDQIEHEELRPLGDPRIHAAIVCASRSCPSLAREPYTAAGIDAELDRAFAGFVADRGKGFAIDRAASVVRLSSIFKWFAQDFDKQGGALSMIGRYLSVEDRAWLEENARTARREYMSYDWHVNG